MRRPLVVLLLLIANALCRSRSNNDQRQLQTEPPRAATMVAQASSAPRDELAAPPDVCFTL
ncbi:MAG: hypothetical protein M3Z22_06255 [Verrucomicrobiota bacterium]|nr:hypothetical protein [Verrucomicrobiota bacterium]